MDKGREEKERGNQCFKSSHYHQALAHYTAALRFGVGDQHKVFCNMSFAHFKLKKWEAALQDARRALNLDGSFEKAYYRKGEAHRALGNVSEAIASYCDGLSRVNDPDSMIVSQLCKTILAAEERKQTDKTFQKIIDKGKDHVVNAFAKYAKQKKWEKAFSAWKSGECTDVNNLATLILTAFPVLDVLKGPDMKALDFLIDCLKFNPNEPCTPKKGLPLQVARENGNQAAAVKLIESGAAAAGFCFEGEDSVLNAVTEWTVQRKDGNTQLLDFLLERAEVFTDRKGNSPLHVFCKEFYKSSKARKSVLDKLLKKGYKPNKRNHEGMCPLEMVDSIDWRRSIMSAFEKDGSSTTVASGLPFRGDTTVRSKPTELTKETSKGEAVFKPQSLTSKTTPFKKKLRDSEQTQVKSKDVNRVALKRESTKLVPTSASEKVVSKKLSHNSKVTAEDNDNDNERTKMGGPVEEQSSESHPVPIMKSQVQLPSAVLPLVEKSSAVKKKPKKKKKKKKKTKHIPVSSAQPPTGLPPKEPLSEGKKPSDLLSDIKKSDHLLQLSELQKLRFELKDLLSSLPERNYLNIRLKRIAEARQSKAPEAAASAVSIVAAETVTTQKEISVVRNASKTECEDRAHEVKRSRLFKEDKRPGQSLWEVRCTAEVWKFLHNCKSDLHIVKQVAEKLHMLANGEFRSRLCRPIQGVPNDIMLFETNVTAKVRLIWDKCVAFSPRLSAVMNENCSHEKRYIFSEIIRVWHVVLDHDSLDKKKKEILKSYKKGERAATKTYLEGSEESDYINANDCDKLFHEWSEKGPSKFNSVTTAVTQTKCLPPANPDDREFNIVKFYPVTGDMMNWFSLESLDDVDFQFDVNPDEFEIINSEKRVPTLLLGRSGTGKTTCCLYKMWRSFEKYWKYAKPEAPYYQIEHVPLRVDEANADEVADEDNRDEVAVSSEVTHRQGMSSDYDEESNSSFEKAEDNVHTSLEANDNATERPVVCSVALADNRSAENLQDILPPKSQRNENDSVPEATHCTNESSPVGRSCLELNSSARNNQSVPSKLLKESYCHLQQVFITKNGLLCDRMRKCFLGLSHAHDFTQAHRKAENDRLPFKLQDFDALQFPCFLTIRQWLLLLDASVPDPFFERNEDGAMVAEVNTWGDIDSLIISLSDIDDDSESEPENDSGDSDEDEEPKNISGHLTRSINYTIGDDNLKDSSLEITYAYFESKMWPKVSKDYPSYDVLLVWTEIKSFIEGSLESLHSDDTYLSRDEYNMLGRKRAPNFTGNRDHVYSMFEVYRKLKRQLRAYDECDLVYNLYKRLSKVDTIDWTVNELYVDETQDFTQAEIALLMRCCKDPNAIFLTGDTAQSIMRGVSFRFEDMKTMFYYAQRSNPRIKVPQISTLDQNYRSHSGILEVASSAVDLMECYFKESLDILPKDKGLFPGPKPSWLKASGPESLALMLMGNKRKTSALEFGAHQVVLVRSEEALKNLPAELKCAISMTIFDAKGLEFDDVLLYNFFTDSKIEKEWRILYSFIQEENESYFRHISDTCRPLEFRPSEHKFLCSELKHLYTAVTRARCNLWLYDGDVTKSKPMLEFLKSRDLVVIVTSEEELEKESSDDGGAFGFITTSTTEQWEKRGKYFLNQKSFRPAATCFYRAGNKEKHHYCLSCLCLKDALNMERQWRKIESTEKFIEAAIHLVKGDKPRIAAKYLLKSGEKEVAAQVLEKLGHPRPAAKLYMQMGKLEKAVECLENALDFKGSTEILYRNSRYEDAVKSVSCYNELCNQHPELAKEITVPYNEKQFGMLLWRAAKSCYERKNIEEMERIVERFPEFENRLKFYRRTGQIEKISGVMIKAGRVEEVRQMFWEHGQFLEAAYECQGSSQGDCYLAHVTANSDSLGLKNSFDFLQKAKSCYEACRDWLGLGTCFMLEAELLKSKDLSCNRKARDSFQRADCWCGEIEATAACIRIKFSTEQDWTTAEQAIDRAIKFCSCVCQRKAEKHIVDHCVRFYGLSCLNDRFSAYRESKCRFLEIAKGHETSLDSADLTLEFVVAVFTGRMTSLVAEMLAVAREHAKQRLTYKPCTNFAFGHQCLKIGHGPQCSNIHGSIPRNYWNSQIENIVFGAKIEVEVSNVLRFLSRFSACQNGLSILFKSEQLPLVECLQAIICPSEWQLCLIPLSPFCQEGLQKLRNKTAVKKKLADLIKERWLSEKQTTGNVNLTQTYWSLLSVVDGIAGVKEFRSLMIENQKNYIQFLMNPNFNNTRKHRLIHGDMNISSPAASCNLFTNLWDKAKRQYSDEKIVEYVQTVMDFLSRSMNRPHAPSNDPPLLSETLNILESTSFCCLLMLFHLQPFEGQECYLPQRYVQTAAFWDMVIYEDSDFLISAIRNIILSGNILKRVRDTLKLVVYMIVGEMYRNFFILNYALTMRHCIESGGAERMLMLAATLHYNFTKIEGLDNLKTSLCKSLKRVNANVAFKRYLLFPKHLKKVLGALSAPDADSRCRNALMELLLFRQEKLLKVVKIDAGFNFIPVDLSNAESVTETSDESGVTHPEEHSFNPDDNKELDEGDQETESDKENRQCIRRYFVIWKHKNVKKMERKRVDRFHDFRVGSFGCQICDVRFKESKEGINIGAVDRKEHLESKSHETAHKHLETYKRGYFEFQKLQQKTQEVLKSDQLDLDFDYLRNEMDEYCKTARTYEESRNWEGAAKFMNEIVPNLRAKLAKLKEQREKGTVALVEESLTATILRQDHDGLEKEGSDLELSDIDSDSRKLEHNDQVLHSKKNKTKRKRRKNKH